jgi:serine/threonine-protein kinase
MEIVLKHSRETPVAPSHRSELKIPASLDELIMTCLEKDPDRRPATADALADRLATVLTASAWSPQRASEWWDVHHPAR